MEQPKQRPKQQAAKTEYISMGIWADPGDGHIHISGRKPHSFITTVGRKAQNARGHPHLYDKLKAILKRAGKWPPRMEEHKKRKAHSKARGLTMVNERKEILELFRRRGLRSGQLYPLSDFIRDIDFDGDPGRADAKRRAFRELEEEGFFVEMSAALELTEKGYRAIQSKLT